VKGWKKIFHANGSGKKKKKKPEVAIRISDKINFKANTAVGHKEGHYIIPIKGSIQ